MALHQITSLRPIFLALFSGPLREPEQVSPENLPVFHWQSNVWMCQVGPTVTLTHARSQAPWETDTACIRISLLAYCAYTLCEIGLRPQAMLSLYLNCIFPLYIFKSLKHSFRKPDPIIFFHEIPTCRHPQLLIKFSTLFTKCPQLFPSQGFSWLFCRGNSFEWDSSRSCLLCSEKRYTVFLRLSKQFVPSRAHQVTKPRIAQS